MTDEHPPKLSNEEREELEDELLTFQEHIAQESAKTDPNPAKLDLYADEIAERRAILYPPSTNPTGPPDDILPQRTIKCFGFEYRAFYYWGSVYAAPSEGHPAWNDFMAIYGNIIKDDPSYRTPRKIEPTD